MASRSSLQSWLRAQLRAAQAEHELLVATANCVRGTGERPSAAAIANAKRLRTKATAEFRLALAELRLCRRALDQRFVTQERTLTEAVQSSHYFVGTEKTYQLAVLALIETHPDRKRLGQAIERLFAEHAPGAGEPETQAMVHGVMDAQSLIRLANVVNPRANSS